MTADSQARFCPTHPTSWPARRVAALLPTKPTRAGCRRGRPYWRPRPFGPSLHERGRRRGGPARTSVCKFGKWAHERCTCGPSGRHDPWHNWPVSAPASIARIEIRMICADCRHAAGSVMMSWQATWCCAMRNTKAMHSWTPRAADSGPRAPFGGSQHYLR